MILKTLMKNPILVIGIILFSLFIHQVVTKEKWSIFNDDRFDTSSCRGAVVRIEKYIPANWKAECEGNNLAIMIKENTPAQDQHLQAMLYRQLANHMSYVARIATVDVLEKVDWVRFKLIHKNMTINAVTEGKYIVKLATLEDPELIRSHLQSTVQVQEVRE